MVAGGRPLAHLEKLCAVRRVVPHGVSLSIGSVTDLDRDYLNRLSRVISRADPPWFSDHVCFCRVGENDVHDLLPIPHTREAVAHVAERIRRVQGMMERPMAIENVSSYLTYK